MPPQSPKLTIPKLTIQLDWKFNVQFAGLLLADRLGLYRDRHLDLQILPWSEGLPVPEVVAADPLMIGCAEPNLILDAQARGAPIKAIAAMFQASPYALMCLPDSGITQLSDLDGKTVGVHVDGTKLLDLVKGVNHLPNIRVVEVPYAHKLDRLLSGELAALQCYAVDEPIGFAQQLGQPPILLSLEQLGFRAYAQVLFATEALLSRYPEQVGDFLAASFQGWQLALADIPQTARIVAEQYADPGSKYSQVDYQAQSLALIRPYVMPDAETLGTIALDRWQETADLMAEYGIIAQAPDPTVSLDLSLWHG